MNTFRDATHESGVQEFRMDLAKPCQFCTADAFYFCGHYKPDTRGASVAEGGLCNCRDRCTGACCSAGVRACATDKPKGGQ